MKKRASRWIFAIVLLLTVPAAAIVVFWFVLFGSCGSNKEAISMARGLPKQRLARLFDDMRVMRPKQGYMPLIVVYENEKEIPRSIVDLHPRSLTLTDRMAIVHLSGCMDDKVSLSVLGLDSKQKGEVILDPGEVKDPVVLWTER